MAVNAITDFYQMMAGQFKPSLEQIQKEFGPKVRVAMYTLEASKSLRCNVEHESIKGLKCTRKGGQPDKHEGHIGPGAALHLPWYDLKTIQGIFKSQIASYHSLGYKDSCAPYDYTKYYANHPKA